MVSFLTVENVSNMESGVWCLTVDGLSIRERVDLHFTKRIKM